MSEETIIESVVAILDKYGFTIISKKEIQSLKEQLRESNRRRDIAEECVDHYAGYPFSTNDIYMDIFELFKIENSSVTSFDSGTFAKKAIEARAKRSEG